MVYNSFQAAAASLSRIEEYMEIQPEIGESDETRRPEAGFKGNIAFKNVTFSYDKEPVLSGIDLAVEAGTTLAIVGPTGAGKSTVALLLARLYEPQEGKIEIDGINLRNIGFTDLRSLLNVVPQEVYLFPGTVRENIRYGNPAAGDEAVEQAAGKVQAHPFIEKLPNGYDSEVGEAGMMLSGGQKQLVALARAYPG
jgi:ABC-type multidrug transport system fused ATPase/permease subunit